MSQSFNMQAKYELILKEVDECQTALDRIRGVLADRLEGIEPSAGAPMAGPKSATDDDKSDELTSLTLDELQAREELALAHMAALLRQGKAAALEAEALEVSRGEREGVNSLVLA